MSEKEYLELENLSHLEQLDRLLESKLKKAVDPLKKAQNNFLVMVSILAGMLSGVISYVYVRQDVIVEKLSEKATKTELTEAVKERERDYLMKLDYYKMEADEHEDLKQIFANPSQAGYILDKINASMRNEMGFNYATSRGGITR